jgi:hypothetical protein
MVNENQEEFFNYQQKSAYLGGAQKNHTNLNSDPTYNNKGDTDISVGATGREPFSKK